MTAEKLKFQAKRILPTTLWEAARQTRHAFGRALQYPAARLHPWRRRSLRQLDALKDVHRGQRAFILGNGPSLKQTDLSRLEGEVTFGLNRIYLAFPGLGFSTTYYLSINDLVIEQCLPDILKLPMPRFLSWRSRRFFTPEAYASLPEPPVFLHTTYTGPAFARYAGRRLWEGATVTYVALQLAYHMGIKQVILIGVDHSFSTQGKPNTTIVSQGEDRDHFDRGYFGKGFRWQLPDLEISEHAYRMARKAYEAADRQVLDATIGGKLTVFPRVDYDTLFG